jgi:hypothetical protein
MLSSQSTYFTQFSLGFCRYKERVVWDKQDRMDLIFGSNPGLKATALLKEKERVEGVVEKYMRMRMLLKQISGGGKTRQTWSTMSPMTTLKLMD